MQITRSRHERSGFLLADVLLGLILLATLATVLALSLNMRSRSAIRLAHQRAALQTAQQVLAALGSDGQAPAVDPGMTVQISRSGTRSGDFEWVEVTVVHEGRRAALVGLARPTTQPGGGP